MWLRALADEYGRSSARRISSLASHRETDIRSVLHFSTAVKDEGWRLRAKGRRKEEERRHSRSATAGGSQSGDARLSPVSTSGMVEIMRSAAWKSPCATQPCIPSVFSCCTAERPRPQSPCHWLQHSFAYESCTVKHQMRARRVGLLPLCPSVGSCRTGGGLRWSSGPHAAQSPLEVWRC